MTSAIRADRTDYYRQRRQRVINKMRAAGGGIAIVPTASCCLRSRDTDYPYRHDSYFYYLTGFTEPQAVLVLNANTANDAHDAHDAHDANDANAAPASVLFCRAKDPKNERWEGFHFGPEAAREAFGFDEAYAIDALDAKLPELLSDAHAVYYALGASRWLDAKVRCWLQAVRAKSRRGIAAPGIAYDLPTLLDEMRLIKDDQELDLMRRAASISANAHCRAMQICQPGMHEYELEAALLYEFRRHGAQSPAYRSIVAAGANTCVLHYPAGDARIRDGDLVLIDAACELDSYAADITRTFPANGRFSAAQRELYEIVLAAQQAAIDTACAGVSFNAPHEAAVRVLAQGLLDIGLIDANEHGTLDDVIDNKIYKRFYMHRTSHWLGMDVHDCGAYGTTGATNTKKHTIQKAAAPEVEPEPECKWRTLVPNMVMTVEPGIYVNAAADVPERYWDIGIRIEDDIIITSTGCEIMTRQVPVHPDEIEALARVRGANSAS